jgi:hypothetical protein
LTVVRLVFLAKNIFEVLMIRSTLIVSLLALSTASIAEEGNDHGPFAQNPGLTTGVADGFFELYLAADEIGSNITPSLAVNGTDHSLVLENPSLSWVEVHIGETRVGILKPLKFGTIEGVDGGTYDIAFTYPNGFVRHFQATSDGEIIEAAPAVVPAAEETGSEETGSEEPLIVIE